MQKRGPHVRLSLSSHVKPNFTFVRGLSRNLFKMLFVAMIDEAFFLSRTNPRPKLGTGICGYLNLDVTVVFIGMSNNDLRYNAFKSGVVSLRFDFGSDLHVTLWSEKPDSNRRPSVPKTDVLPLHHTPIYFPCMDCRMTILGCEKTFTLGPSDW